MRGQYKKNRLIGAEDLSPEEYSPTNERTVYIHGIGPIGAEDLSPEECSLAMRGQYIYKEWTNRSRGTLT